MKVTSIRITQKGGAFVTKEEVLQGALTLNGTDKNYTVTVEDNRIMIQASYQSNPTHTRTGVFRCVAHLNDDHTYVETHFDHDSGQMQGGKVVKVKKSVAFTFGDKDREVEKEQFNSEDLKKILRDYLEGCGYRRKNRGFFKRLFGK